MNHVNLTFHLATRRLIYQNSLFFSLLLSPFIAWNGSGSVVETYLERVSKWFRIRALCSLASARTMLALPPSPHQLSTPRCEFIQGNSFHFTLQKVFASHCSSLYPRASTPQAFTRTRNCIHSASPLFRHGWNLSHSLLLPMAKLLENFPSGVRSSPHARC